MSEINYNPQSRAHRRLVARHLSKVWVHLDSRVIEIVALLVQQSSAKGFPTLKTSRKQPRADSPASR